MPHLWLSELSLPQVSAQTPIPDLSEEGSVDAAARAQLNRAMARLADGDRSAFSAVYAATQPVVTRFAARVLGDAAEAQDVAQRVLLKLFAQAPAFHDDGDVVSWALAITAWECRSAKRAAARRAALRSPERYDDSTLQELAAEIVGALSQQDKEALAESDGPRSPAQRKRKERALEKARRIWRRLYG